MLLVEAQRWRVCVLIIWWVLCPGKQCNLSYFAFGRGMIFPRARKTRLGWRYVGVAHEADQRLRTEAITISKSVSTRVYIRARSERHTYSAAC